MTEANKHFQIKGVLKGTGFFILYAVLMMVFQGVMTVVFMGVRALQGVRNELQLTTFANDNLLGCVLGSNILMGLTFYLIYRLRNKSVVKEWKLFSFSWMNVIVPSICTLAYTLLYMTIISRLGITEPDMVAESANYYSSIAPGLGVIMMTLNLIIFAPLVEEIVLRGVVYTNIKSTTNVTTAIIGSALLFGVMHIMAGGIALAIGAFLMGLILGCIYAKTNNLWICIIAHAVANLPDLYFYLFN